MIDLESAFSFDGIEIGKCDHWSSPATVIVGPFANSQVANQFISDHCGNGWFWGPIGEIKHSADCHCYTPDEFLRKIQN